MICRRPEVSEYNPKYSRYMDLVPEDDICATLESQLSFTVSLLREIPDSLIDYRYAPGKWTTREVIGHILDTDRIFGFRLMSFARGDSYPLSAADQDLYVATGEFARYPLSEWIEEYSLIRKSNIALIRHLPAAAWDRTGIVSGLAISVRAIAYFMAGHERYHLGILQNRYMKQLA
jgi:hypothetical protein